MKTNQMKAMIVDDEPLAREDLKSLLAAHPEIKVKCEAGTIEAAEALLQNHHLDVVFLDIQLRGGTGFDLVPTIDPSIKIIFITAHDTFAIRAFEVNALDYLLKPVQAERLAASIERLESRRRAGRRIEQQPSGALKPTDRILVNTDKGRVFVNLETILAITSMGGNYTVLNTEIGDSLVTRKSMRAWEALLPDTLFFRIHRATIVNTSTIDRLRTDSSGACRVCLRGQYPAFPVSRRMAPRLKKLVAERS